MTTPRRARRQRLAKIFLDHYWTAAPHEIVRLRRAAPVAAADTQCWPVHELSDCRDGHIHGPRPFRDRPFDRFDYDFPHPEEVSRGPLAWNGILLAIQLQYWWAINQLSNLGRQFNSANSSGHDDVHAVSEDLGIGCFFRAGRTFWLLTITAFMLFGFVVNVFGSQSPLDTAWAATDIPIIILPALAFLSRKRKHHADITAVYLPRCLGSLHFAS